MRTMSDAQFMRLALRLAKRGYGTTSPNPMVGAVLVKRGNIIGRGWHRRAGEPHAEIEALRDAQRRGQSTPGATLYVTLEPCSTHGRTPPCTEAIITAGIERVVAGTADPNPKHAGRAFRILRRSGIAVASFGGPSRPSRDGSASEPQPDLLKAELQTLNEPFDHWIVHGTPFVTVKAAMTLDGKIATASGESKWITGEKARACGMKLRQGADAILVGVNTVLADNPSLTARIGAPSTSSARAEAVLGAPKLRRIVLDSLARTPLSAKVVSDGHSALTTIVVSRRAPKRRVAALAKRVNVMVAPARQSQISILKSQINVRWLLKKLGGENVTSLLVEGGGEVNASFLLGGFAHRIAFFFAPKILGGRNSRKAVAGQGIAKLSDVIQLRELEWRRLGPDLLLTARVVCEEME